MVMISLQVVTRVITVGQMEEDNCSYLLPLCHYQCQCIVTAMFLDKSLAWIVHLFRSLTTVETIKKINFCDGYGWRPSIMIIDTSNYLDILGLFAPFLCSFPNTKCDLKQCPKWIIDKQMSRKCVNIFRKHSARTGITTCYYNERVIKIQHFHSRKCIDLKISSVKWWPFCQEWDKTVLCNVTSRFFLSDSYLAADICISELGHEILVLKFRLRGYIQMYIL